MRTKTLLLVAALSAAGVATSMAQVYSVNIVGYANVVLNGTNATPALNKPLTLVANPFDDGNGNQLTNLLSSSLPKNSAVLTWAGTTYSSISRGASAWAGSISLPPGVGFFVRNNSGNPITNTFVGSVVVNVGQSSTNTVLGTNAFASGLGTGYPNGNLFGSRIPYTGDLTTSTNLNLASVITTKNSQILTWKNNGPTFTTSTRGASAWNSPAPLGVGEGFFLNDKAGANTNWVQTLY